jgi:gliding motility-associated-like protein
MGMKRIVLLVFILAVFFRAYSQSLSPVVIATSGDFVQGQTYSIAWTLGEVVSETYSVTNIFLTQGFHQPSIKNDTSKIDPPFEFFNGFSPNGDGINDWWNIPMLDKYTNNKVTIINRWGSEVWIMDNYDNKLKVFKGQNMNGDELPDGTYFYIIKYDNREKRGWVIIKR